VGEGTKRVTSDRWKRREKEGKKKGKRKEKESDQ
jgi:hypothetical protein